MDIISSHSTAKCVKFAEVLLNDSLLVQRFKRDNKGEDELFIQAVLEKWVSSVEGPAMECTWPNLIECMKLANMNDLEIQNIRDVVIPSAGETME